MKLALGIFVLVACPACLLAFLGLRDLATPSSAPAENAEVRTSDKGIPFTRRRATFQTRLRRRGAAPQEGHAGGPPDGVQEITYHSGKLKLTAWLAFPKYPSSRYPALVYFHSGFALGPTDLEQCQPFLDVGCVVMCPMLRGENGNPGDFEMFFGELDDACAAIHWLAQQRYVETGQIYTFGHGTGGAISALLSLVDDVPVRLTGSAGGLYGPDDFDTWGAFAPFDLSDPVERDLRLLMGNIRHMQRPHYAYVGRADRLQRHLPRIRQEMADAGSRLVIFKTEGDHLTSLRPALSDFWRAIRVRNRIPGKTR